MIFARKVCQEAGVDSAHIINATSGIWNYDLTIPLVLFIK